MEKKKQGGGRNHQGTNDPNRKDKPFAKTRKVKQEKTLKNLSSEISSLKNIDQLNKVLITHAKRGGKLTTQIPKMQEKVVLARNRTTAREKDQQEKWTKNSNSTSLGRPGEGQAEGSGIGIIPIQQTRSPVDKEYSRRGNSSVEMCKFIP